MVVDVVDVKSFRRLFSICLQTPPFPPLVCLLVGTSILDFLPSLSSKWTLLQLSFDFCSRHVVKFASFHQDNLVGQENLFCIPSWYHLTSTQLTKNLPILLVVSSYPTSFFPWLFNRKKSHQKHTHGWLHGSYLLTFLALPVTPVTHPRWLWQPLASPASTWSSRGSRGRRRGPSERREVSMPDKLHGY